jgi:Flp pilus assembly protein TadG
MAVPDRARSDRGAGLFGTSFGILFFLGFLLFAVQLLFNLYATSVVTSATYDAARQVATSASQPATPEQLAAAEEHARGLLGRYGQTATFSWDLDDPDVIKLRVVVRNPRVLSTTLAKAVGFDTIDRTVTVRVEALR